MTLARPAPDTAPAPVRVVVAIPHPLLREAIAALVASDPSLELVGTTGDPLGVARAVRDAHPDVLVLARGLALPSSPSEPALLPEAARHVAVLVTGMGTDAAYGTAARAAGAAGFVPVDDAPEALLDAIGRAARQPV